MTAEEMEATVTRIQNECDRKIRAERIEWQNASGLCVPADEDGGDPSGVKPHHVERYILKVEAERDELARRLADMERKWATAVAFGCVIEAERDALLAKVQP